MIRGNIIHSLHSTHTSIFGDEQYNRFLKGVKIGWAVSFSNQKNAKSI